MKLKKIFSLVFIGTMVLLCAESATAKKQNLRNDHIIIKWAEGVTPEQKAVIEDAVSHMIYVPGGAFYFENNCYGRLTDSKGMLIKNHWISQHEVSQELWKAVMGNNPSTNKGANLPVSNVSWEDCQKFIKKLNSMTGLKFRLPNIYEWHYDAGGEQWKDKTQIDAAAQADVGWIHENSNHTVHPIAMKGPNSIGLYDVIGNLKEWTSTADNLPNYDLTYYNCGGAFNTLNNMSLVEAWARNVPSYGGSNIGLRLALNASNSYYSKKEPAERTTKKVPKPNHGSSHITKINVSNQYGYIYTNGGDIIVPPIYDETGASWSDGCIKVKEGKKWGYYDLKGNQITPCIYDKAEDFVNGKAVVTKDGRKFTIDKTGKEIQ